nr:WD repeat, SAM and U-box domain-containing protein 1-like isoform X1 [Pocillopora verrucosa]
MAVLVNTFAKHATDVTSCSFSPNSKVLASSSGDKSVRLWNIENGSELSVSPLLGHTYSVNSCSFSPFGTILATASTDCSVFLWDVDSGSMITVLQGHKNVVRVCRFSPNSRFLLTGSADETFCIWDVSSKKLVKCVDGLESSVLTCCFTPDSLHIVTGTSMGDLCIWDAQSGKMMKFYAEGHDLGVADCCFSPTFGSAILNTVESSFMTQVVLRRLGLDTNYPAFQDTSGGAPQFMLATGGNDNLVKLWDIFTASAFSAECHIRKRCSLNGHQGPVHGIAMSPNGKIMASGSSDKLVILWDPLLGVSLLTLEGHTRYVTCCAFSLDGNWMATGSNDRMVKLWKICLTESGELDQSGRSTSKPILQSTPVKKQEPQEPKKQRKKLVTWSIDDVCSWLISLDLDIYCESFRQNAIDGMELSNMTSEVLASDLGIGPAGHRNKILRTVKEIKKEELEEDIPDEFLCPITREIMTDPVIAADGYTYERASIDEWLTSGRLTSPMTNAPLKNSSLTPNRMLFMLIQRHFSGQNINV